MTIHSKTQPLGLRRAAGAVASALAVAALITAAASAMAAAAPQSSSAPTISGQARVGRTLVAGNGSWTNTPTGFGYQWQQCDGSGAGCTAIAGATAKSYAVAAGDSDHTLRVVVNASNSDGSASANSQPTAVVSSDSAPANTASPTISGTPKVGEQLTADPGSWTGGVRTYTYAWQRCDSAGGSCSAVPDATAKAYGVRTVDVGNTLRVVVTATNLAGSTNATSSPSSTVASDVVPTPVGAHTKPPTIAFIGLSRVGTRIYARFSICDDSPRTVTVIEHDLMPGTLGYTRRFSVAPQPCGAHARNWLLIPRFRHAGRFSSTLRAVDKTGASSRTVSRSISLHGAL
jgi:hypothetical protein